MRTFAIAALILASGLLLLGAATPPNQPAAPAAGPTGGPGGPPPPPPPARKIPALTDEDPFPRGCVDCHVNWPDFGVDTRLSVIMGRLESGADPKTMERTAAAAPGLKLDGKHPQVRDLGDIPRTCGSCHDGAQAPAFGPLMHTLHLSGGDKSYYLGLFGGECTHCHKPDGRGGWSLPSAAES